ncbi:hypothetical protein P2318_13985 [Myxococcaceae bacterium GXIMD 01537]
MPQLRLQWQLTLFQDRRDALVFLAEGGLGRSISLPETAVEGARIPFTAFYSHPALAGLGYRNHNPSGWYWGFQVTAGPVWYGAHYEGLVNESRTGGLLEGRIQIGRRAGPVALGLGVGYAEPFSVPRRSVAKDFLGGFMLGFFADWR